MTGIDQNKMQAINLTTLVINLGIAFLTPMTNIGNAT
jgi:translocator protein